MTFALENKQQIMFHAVCDSAVVTIIRAMRELILMPSGEQYGCDLNTTKWP
jgi:hypothetical protein